MVENRTILTLTLLLSAVHLSLPTSRAQDDEASRLAMVQDQIRARGISNPGVLRTMRSVPRHEFVPPDLHHQSYRDHPLPIGYGQTISQPFIVAYMTEAIQPGENDRVLEVGTGSAYQAAVLAEIVDSVFTIEIVPELAESAAERLSRLGYDNVTVRHGDGYFGWPDKAPFDAIVVTAASEHIPPPLIEQLKDGGRMIIPVGTPFLKQSLILVDKRDGKVTTTSLLPVRFVPLRRAEN